MGVINVIDHEGRAHELEAVEGWRVIRRQSCDFPGLPAARSVLRFQLAAVVG